MRERKGKNILNRKKEFFLLSLSPPPPPREHKTAGMERSQRGKGRETFGVEGREEEEEEKKEEKEEEEQEQEQEEEEEEAKIGNIRLTYDAFPYIKKRRRERE